MSNEAPNAGWFEISNKTITYVGPEDQAGTPVYKALSMAMAKYYEEVEGVADEWVAHEGHDIGTVNSATVTIGHNNRGELVRGTQTSKLEPYCYTCEEIIECE